MTGTMGSRGTALLLAVLLAICLLGLGRGLWTPDEPREAEISREMLLSPGVVPTLNGRTFIEKPPLYYWAVAGVFKLTSDVSPATARLVSALSGFFTLLLVFLWGRREFSPAVGLAAALGLATSLRFLISSHWILSDPLLMLFTTAALWAGWELLEHGGRWRTAAFYGALVLALWTKGLIGPVLVAAGFVVYSIVEFRQAPWRRVHVIVGILAMLAATAALASLIYASSGLQAVREWFWVNHVARFIAPEGTGHERPFYYYLWAIPVAVLPWWIGAFESFKPRVWRGDSGHVGVRRYWGLMSIGMALMLSASVTKRELYLLPLLPPLFLLLAAHAVAAWYDAATHLKRSVRWWLQLAVCTCFTVGPVVVVAIYLRTADAVVIGFLAAAAAAVMATGVFTLRGNASRALAGLGVTAVAGAVGLFGIVPHQAGFTKNMEPFLRWVDEQLPAGAPVFAIGHVDETLEGIVPFTTGRDLIEVTKDDVGGGDPKYLLVQDTENGRELSRVPTTYKPVRVEIIGQERYLALWQYAGSTDDTD